MAVRVEREQPLLEGIAERPVRAGGEVDSRAGEDMRERLHVGLRVAAAYAQRVQLHQLARVVLVDRVAGVLGVVEVDQHRRVHEHRTQQLAEFTEHMRPDGVLLVIREEKQDLLLALENVEVIEPEPSQHFLELVRRIKGPNRAPLECLEIELGKILTQRFDHFALLVVGLSPRRLARLPQLRSEIFGARARHRQGVDEGPRLRRQRVVATEDELAVEVAFAPERAQGLDVSCRSTVGDAVEKLEIGE